MTSAASEAERTPPLRVMIVEDEVIIAAALSSRLKMLGYQVVEMVHLADHAHARAAVLVPDVLLMDIHLGGAEDGIDVAQRIRDDLGIPVVYSTAYADPQTLQRAQITEPYGYLVKPYDDASLRVALELAVHRHRHELERRSLERQLLQAQKMEAVGRFASSVAHDFNNLLTIITASLDIGDMRPAERPRLNDDIRRAVRRGADLSRRLLLFTRRDRAEPKNVDLVAAMHALKPLLRNLMGPEIRVALSTPERPLWTVIDPLHFDQCMLNLAANARDAMPDGGTFSISLHPEDGGIILRVKDTGAGVPDPIRDQIFEPFFTTKGPDDGTGLGLSTVKRIIASHGGQVCLASTPGEGATFIIQLPARSPLVQVVRAAPDTENMPDADAVILLVEQDPELLRMMNRMMTDAGHTVYAVSDPGLAMSAIQQLGDRVDLLLTAVRLPYVRGPELAGRLQRYHPDLRVGYLASPPDNPDDRATLNRPFDRERLLQFIQEQLAATVAR
ncbi:MAG: response regulator [Myxococcota bacterium]